MNELLQSRLARSTARLPGGGRRVQCRPCARELRTQAAGPSSAADVPALPRSLVSHAEQGQDVQEKVDKVEVELRRPPDGRAGVAVLQLDLVHDLVRIVEDEAAEGEHSD